METSPFKDQGQSPPGQASLNDCERIDRQNRFLASVIAWRCGGEWSSKYIRMTIPKNWLMVGKMYLFLQADLVPPKS